MAERRVNSCGPGYIPVGRRNQQGMNILIATLALLQAPAADYAETMRKVSAKFTGKEGVVVHLGDSITYANPYGGWARFGAGKTPQDQAICKWMHVGADNDTD